MTHHFLQGIGTFQTALGKRFLRGKRAEENIFAKLAGFRM